MDHVENDEERTSTERLLNNVWMRCMIEWYVKTWLRMNNKALRAHCKLEHYIILRNKQKTNPQNKMTLVTCQSFIVKQIKEYNGDSWPGEDQSHDQQPGHWWSEGHDDFIQKCRLSGPSWRDGLPPLCATAHRWKELKEGKKDMIRKVIKQFRSWIKWFANQMLLSVLLMAVTATQLWGTLNKIEREESPHGALNVITNNVKNKYAADPSLSPPSKIQTTNLFQIRRPWKFATTSRRGRLWCEYKGVYSTLFWCNSKTQIIYREQHWDWQATCTFIDCLLIINTACLHCSLVIFPRIKGY